MPMPNLEEGADGGRTIVFRGTHGEIVVSSSHPEDTLEKIRETLDKIIKNIKLKGGTISYVG